MKYYVTSRTVGPAIAKIPKNLPFLKDLYKEIIRRSPKNGRFFGVQVQVRSPAGKA